MRVRLAKLGIALLNLILGSIVGLLLLEGVLHINPMTLPRPMELPFPADYAITTQIYDVYYSDADLFYWHGNLIEPIKPEKDRIEASVTYYLDQFGFPNQYPQSENVDIIVLGRSFSRSAQATNPWIRQIEANMDVDILNLAQPGGGLANKIIHLQKYGLPRDPEWVILVIVPSMNILPERPGGNERTIEPLLAKSFTPTVQAIARSQKLNSTSEEATNYIFPLRLELSNGEAELTFIAPFLEGLTVSQQELSQSNQWTSYSQGLTEFVQLAEQEDFCLAFMLAATKPDVYFPLSANPAQLDVLAPYFDSWSLDEKGTLIKNLSIPPDGITMQQNALDQWSLLQEYAKQNDIPFINPIPSMQAAVNQGQSPFMQYDSHWGPLGHRIVAELVEDTLTQSSCK